MENQARYGITMPVPPPTPAPAGKPLDVLRQAVRGFAPTAKLQAYELIDEDGVHPAFYTYSVKLSGPEVRTAVISKGSNVNEVVLTAKRAWAKERRATDVFRLVEECQRIVGGSLEEEFEETLTTEMRACSVSDFVRLAAKWRRAAVVLKNKEA